jgi:hypothetical protein
VTSYALLFGYGIELRVWTQRASRVAQQFGAASVTDGVCRPRGIRVDVQGPVAAVVGRDIRVAEDTHMLGVVRLRIVWEVARTREGSVAHDGSGGERGGALEVCGGQGSDNLAGSSQVLVHDLWHVSSVGMLSRGHSTYIETLLCIGENELGAHQRDIGLLRLQDVIIRLVLFAGRVNVKVVLVERFRIRVQTRLEARNLHVLEVVGEDAAGGIAQPALVVWHIVDIESGRRPIARKR